MRKVITYTILVSLLALILPVALCAYPSALNLVPTADMMGANQLKLSYESDGHNQPFGDEQAEYIYSQVGIGDKLEFGVDLYDIRHSNEAFYNAKYLVTAEKDNVPAIAIGARCISAVCKTSLYAVGYRSFEKARLHFGAETQDGENYLMFGADYDLGSGVSLLADWETGVGQYSTAGIYWQASKAASLGLYWAHNNTASLRDTYDYLGGYVAYTFTLK